MYWSVVLLVVFLVGCAAPNQVERLEAADGITQYTDLQERRFGNLYPGKKRYPYTCKENCYPVSSLLQCEENQPAENCKFVGENLVPDLSLGVSVKWLGHASFQIIMKDGSVFLFDPVSRQFDWPVNWAFRLDSGFNRKEPKWLTQNQIAEVDAVMYSHIHYDHFNKADIKKIGNQPKYLVPLNFAEHFSSNDYKISEMSWYSSTKVGKTDVHFVPAHHFSSRIWVPYIYNDDDKTLWGGWVLEEEGKRIFFAGDTGYSDHFKDIQQTYGDMDICLIPIASYFHEQSGEWYRYVHTTPEDALQAAQDLNCKAMVPWGYGNASWKMGDHSSHSPLLRLLHMANQLKIDTPLIILNEGEIAEF